MRSGGWSRRALEGGSILAGFLALIGLGSSAIEPWELRLWVKSLEPTAEGGAPPVVLNLEHDLNETTTDGGTVAELRKTPRETFAVLRLTREKDLERWTILKVDVSGDEHWCSGEFLTPSQGTDEARVTLCEWRSCGCLDAVVRTTCMGDWAQRNLEAISKTTLASGSVAKREELVRLLEEQLDCERSLITDAVAKSTVTDALEKSRLAYLEGRLLAAEVAAAEAAGEEPDRVSRSSRDRRRDRYLAGAPPPGELPAAPRSSGTESESDARATRERLRAEAERVDALFVLGWTRYSLEKFEQAERAFEQALRIRPESSLLQNALALSLHRQATPEKLERAISLYEQALGPPLNPYADTILSNLALAHQELGEHARARSLHEVVLAARERMHGAEHPDVAESLNNLASAHQQRLETLRVEEPDAVPSGPTVEEIEDLYGRAIRIQAAAVREAGAGARGQVGGPAPEALDLATTVSNLALLYELIGREAIDPEIAVALNEQGLPHRLSDQSGAEAPTPEHLLLMSLAIKREADYGDQLLEVATVRHNLGMRYLEERRYGPAVEALEGAWQARVSKPQVAQLTRTLNRLLSAYIAKGPLEKGAYEEASARIQEADNAVGGSLLKVAGDELGDGHPEVLSLQFNLGVLAHAQGQYQRAQANYLATLCDSRAELLCNCELRSAEGFLTTDAFHNLGMVYLAQRDYDDAEGCYERALRTQGEASAGFLHQLAVVYHAQGKYARAEEHYRRALDGLAARSDRDASDRGNLEARIHHNFAELYKVRGKYRKAEVHYREARSGSARDPAVTAMVLEGYADLLRKMRNRAEEAAQLEAEAERVRQLLSSGDAAT